ncbi:alpha/beta hydrolase [Sphingomonas oligophenolica]|uniref:Alpha/beta hydrolase n=1 Tax=Sphingomonas oligophenolica TaxID=301154 RepID=A0ABU9Y8F6_9SPHN
MPSTIDPDLLPFVDALNEAWAEFPNLDRLPLAEQRAAAEQVRRRWTLGGPVMRRREDLTAPGPGRAVPIRLMSAADPGGLAPVFVYLHGGGFTTFSLDTHDRIMREYAARSGATVIGVDYALSPEQRFPTALHEVMAVLDWVTKTGQAQGIDPTRVAIGGDSAGANLALSACLMRRDEGNAPLSALLLAYGFFDDDFTGESHRDHGGPGKLLTSTELGRYLDNYLGPAPYPDDPLALPARAALHDLPPSFHIVAECDPLADSDRRIAERMAGAGNMVRCKIYRGATHSFLEAVSIAPIAERAVAESAAWLVERFSR